MRGPFGACVPCALPWTPRALELVIVADLYTAELMRRRYLLSESLGHALDVRAPLLDGHKGEA